MIKDNLINKHDVAKAIIAEFELTKGREGRRRIRNILRRLDMLGDRKYENSNTK